MTATLATTLPPLPLFCQTPVSSFPFHFTSTDLLLVQVSSLDHFALHSIPQQFMFACLTFRLESYSLHCFTPALAFHLDSHIALLSSKDCPYSLKLLRKAIPPSCSRSHQSLLIVIPLPLLTLRLRQPIALHWFSLATTQACPPSAVP